MIAHFEPPMDVPADLEAWMHTQRQSAFVGDMLRVLLRNGGLTARQIAMLEIDRKRSEGA